MNEKDLIRQLKAMREIKPRKDWVSLTKSQILGQETYEKRVSFSLPVFGWKWALAPALAVLLVAGFLAFNQMLPAEQLRVAEEPDPAEEPAIAASDPEKEKMAEMIKKTDDLVVALGQLTETIKITPGLAQEAAEDVAKVEEEIVKLGQLLAVLHQQAEEPAEQSLEQQVEYLIADFETRTLNQEQQELLESAKADAEAKDFDKAIEKLLEI